MRLHLATTAAIVALMAALVVACGGGDRPRDADDEAAARVAAETYETSLAELTTNDLAALVLQQGDYGLLALGMTMGDESGFVDNAEAAHDLVPTGLTEADLDRSGRLGGYELTYDGDEIAEGTILEVTSWVDLFSGVESRDKFINWNLKALEVGGPDELTVLEMAEVPIENVEEASGWRMTLEVPGIELPLTWEFGIVRHGRLIGGVAVLEPGERDLTPELSSLLEQIDRRIRGALEGTSDAAMEHVIPAVDDGKIDPPEGTPDLAALAPTAADLGSGWRPDDEGYYEPTTDAGEREALFVRRYRYAERGDPIVVGEPVASIEVEVQDWATETDATAYLESWPALFGEEVGAQHWASLVGAERKIAVLEPQSEIVELPYGDDGLRITFTGDFEEIGPRAVEVLVIRTGSLVTKTTIEREGAPFDETAAAEITELVAASMDAAPRQVAADAESPR